MWATVATGRLSTERCPLQQVRNDPPQSSRRPTSGKSACRRAPSGTNAADGPQRSVDRDRPPGRARSSRGSSEPEKRLQWVSGLSFVRAARRDGRYREVMEEHGQRIEGTSTVVRDDPPHALDVEHGGSRLHRARGVAARRSTAARTRVTSSLDLRSAALFRFAGGVVGRQAQRSLERSLARLKELVEAEGPASERGCARRPPSPPTRLRRGYRRPERMTPRRSQPARTTENAKPRTERKWMPKSVGPSVGEEPDQRRAEQPTGHDERDHEPVEADVELVHELVEPLVDEADLDLAVAHLLQHVVHLVRKLARDAERAAASPRCARAREPLRREALQHERPRVRPRDLEHVEVRIEVDADGAERGDRLVEHDEARRQPQVHRVDEREALADHLDRVDLGEAERRSSGRRGRGARP